MKVVLTNLSNQLYENSRKRLNDSAKKFGIEEIYSYDISEIKNTPFFEGNREILSNPKGIGYWLWKPYIILEALKKVGDGDIIIYCDCGIQIIQSLTPLINICHNRDDILLFKNCNYLNSMWTKRDCFILMDCNSTEYWNSPHCDAAFSIFKKSDISLKFVNEWLAFGSNKFIISDLPNICSEKNLPEFIDHRWDQSILSLLAKKYNLNLYRMPTQFGNHYKMLEYRIKDEFNCISQSDRNQVEFYASDPLLNSPYGQLLDHHRSQTKQNLFKLIYSKIFL